MAEEINISIKVQEFRKKSGMSLRELAAQGKSMIVISSELEEVLRVSDRIVVMCEGRITGTLDTKEATSELLMKHATAHQ